jgi:regulator of sigma E protease
MFEAFLHAFNALSYSVVGFLFVLTIVVFFHELGHFAVARWAGVKVLTFSLGFGPELFGFNDRHGTRWKVSAIPLGGYVKFFGDESEASTPSNAALAAMTAAERKESFHHQKVGPRAAIVAAGPIANFILATFIFAGLLLCYGKTASIARVDVVQPDSVAASAGFKVGDVVTAIDDQAIESFADMQRIVSMNADTSLVFKLRRDGTETSITATPALKVQKDVFGNAHKVGQLGIQYNSGPNDPKVASVGIGEALQLGVERVWFIISSTFKFLGSLFAGHGGAENLGGPLAIARLSGQAAHLGIQYLVDLCGIISVSIGLLNLFPVPLLDGGHLLFYGIEAARGRALSERAQEVGFRIGLGLVLMLMVFATYNDILRWTTS